VIAGGERSRTTPPRSTRCSARWTSTEWIDSRSS
jgi:hypothetical protein